MRHEIAFHTRNLCAPWRLRGLTPQSRCCASPAGRFQARVIYLLGPAIWSRIVPATSSIVP
jgi:hypothetical protein